MNIEAYMAAPADEKPLDRIVTDGGFCSIFRTIGCIGDSLSSGEFESLDAHGNKSYHDLFEYSWGQYIARSAGCKVYNFSRGGMTAREYVESFAQQNGFWDEGVLCQAYILALGVNDVKHMPVGTMEDVYRTAAGETVETFAGYYSRILLRLKAMQPRARFFLMTMLRDGSQGDALRAEHRDLLEAMTRYFDRTYLLDFFTYGPVYDEAFKRRFYLGGHMNPAGYVLTARMVESYIDYIVRHRTEEFAQVGFIGTSLYCGNE